MLYAIQSQEFYIVELLCNTFLLSGVYGDCGGALVDEE